MGKINRAFKIPQNAKTAIGIRKIIHARNSKSFKEPSSALPIKIPLDNW
jgi:hypothetical protein